MTTEQQSRRLAGGGEQPAPSHVEGFLCKAWGETDLPEARLVRTREEWEAFVVEAQWGQDTTYASLDADDREMVDAQARYIAHDMADNNEGQINFEIGGVSVERVTFLSATPPAGATVEGMKLVPVEPTREMKDAAVLAMQQAQCIAHEAPPVVWAAMLAASPASAIQAGEAPVLQPVALMRARMAVVEAEATVRPYLIPDCPPMKRLAEAIAELDAALAAHPTEAPKKDQQPQSTGGQQQ